MKKFWVLFVCLCVLTSLSSCEKDSLGNKNDESEVFDTTMTNETVVPKGTSSLIQAVFQSTNGKKVNYWLYSPEVLTDTMPLIIYLHVGTGKGDNLDLLMQHEGFPQFIQQKKLTVPAYVVMPQADESVRGWDEMDGEVMDLIFHVAEEYAIDNENISLTGHSMGGIGAWLIGHAHPDVFSRIAPLSGTVSRRLKDHADEIKTPVWSFVGTEPSDSNAYNSNKAFFPQLEQHNPNVRLTVLEGYGHREVVRAYLEYDIIEWLIGSE